MALREFTRLTERLLARMGEEALLRGTVQCRAHIEHGVEVQGSHGEVAFERVVATLQKSLLPRQGDTLAIGKTIDDVWTPEASYVVDSPPFADNGYTVRVVVR
jgi:hypothetical protein